MPRPETHDQFRVRCGGATHRILFDGKRVFFPDHRRGDLNFLRAVGGTHHRCAEILDAVRTRKRLHRLPAGLTIGLEAYWTARQQARHGTPIPLAVAWPSIRTDLRDRAVTRHFRPLLQACATRGLQVHLRCPWPCLDPDTPRPACLLRPGPAREALLWTKSHVLAVRRQGRWEPSSPGITDAVRTVGVAAMGLWMSPDQRRCIPCGFASAYPLREYLPPPASGPGSLIAHARSGEHWRVILDILETALEATR